MATAVPTPGVREAGRKRWDDVDEGWACGGGATRRLCLLFALVRWLWLSSLPFETVPDAGLRFLALVWTGLSFRG